MRADKAENKTLSIVDKGLWIVTVLVALMFIGSKLSHWGALSTPEHSDFRTYYLAAQVASQAPASLYDHKKGLSFSTLRGGVLPYLYPPTVAWMLRPLGRIPFVQAQRIWFWSSVVACMGIVLTVLLMERTTKVTWWGVGLWLLLPAVLDTLFLGQINFFIGLMVVLGMWGYRSRHPAWQAIGGASIGFVGGIKVFPLLLTGMSFMTRKKWLFALGIAAGLGLFIVLGVLGMPMPAWKNYMDVMREGTHTLAPAGSWSIAANQSLLAWWQKLAHTGKVDLSLSQWSVSFENPPLISSTLATWCGYGSVILVLALTVAAMMKARFQGNPSNDRTWALGMLTILMVSPVTWWHYTVIFPSLFVALLNVRASLGAWSRLALPVGYGLIVAQRGIVLLLRIVPSLAVSSSMLAGLTLMWIVLIYETMFGYHSGK
jgi:hypothetical protein